MMYTLTIFSVTLCCISAMRDKSESKKDALAVEVVPSLAGNPLLGYRFVIQCGRLKFREYSRPETNTLRWHYPAKESEMVEFELPDERCLNSVVTVFISVTQRNQIDNNLWNAQFQLTTPQRHVSVHFHHYAKLELSPTLGQLSAQSYYVQLRCTRTERDPNLLFHSQFKGETMVVLLDNPNCVAFTAKLWVVWPNQTQLGKPAIVMDNLGLRGQTNPVLAFHFANHFLLEISPRLDPSRVYVVYVWCAGDKKMKRPMKFVSTIREEWCTPSKCPLRVLINSKRGEEMSGGRGKDKAASVYDIAVAEADEDWANLSKDNDSDSREWGDEFPAQLVFHKRYGVRIERGATFSWDLPLTTRRRQAERGQVERGQTERGQTERGQVDPMQQRILYMNF